MAELQDPTGLRAVEWKRFIRAPDVQLLDELYIPALSRAVRYDRCCAYFSSHVLAVAARGFGGFIQNLLAYGDDLPKPAARLLVNEQLDQEDLDALLTTGDQSQLIRQLLRQFKTPRNALEKNRLEMLAWLVASGWLEVRVGMMAKTRGVAHAKYGIITDLHGDAIAFMGSDNETGYALVENYEELEIRPSWQDPEFVSYYRQRFEALWQGQDEHVRVLPLPDAVRDKIIDLAPSTPPKEPPPDAQELTTAMLWHFIQAAPYLPGGEYACDATAMVDLWPHQRRVVEDTARAFPAGRLLCDEVGMGKTIEAIQVLRRLLNGRGVQRALLLVPAGLLQQWQEELREKGGLLVPRWERGYLYQPGGGKKSVEAAQALIENDVLLLSREWARLDRNRELVLSVPVWDLVLLDEAHAARRSAQEEREFNSANLLLRLLRELQLRQRARTILLLSATPMQTQPWEPWDLLGVLGIGGRWMVEFDDVRTYYQGIQSLAQESLITPDTATTIARLVGGDDAFLPSPDDHSPGGESLAEKLSFAFGDEQKRYARWLRQGAPLGQRMHRNTRDTLRQYHAMGLPVLPPPQRQVRDEVFDYQEQAERDCYEAIKDYIDKRYEQLEQEKTGKGFVMTVYRRRAASSPLALRLSLRRRLEKLERVIRRQYLDPWLSLDEEQIDTRDLSDADIDEKIDPALPSDPQAAEEEKRQIESLLSRLDALGATDSKLARFWDVLREVTADGRAALVFTEYADTLAYLRDRLRPTYGATLGCFSGAGGQVWDGKGWITVSKAEITERLTNGKLRVLVCTDAASEGLNLQAASALVNYDLPWNPSKVEQRIGRIDRIGQQQRVLPIRNLFLDDSVDMRVYQVLQKRCGLFEHFVGRMQPVLALARKALRQNLRLHQTDAFLEELNQTVKMVQDDQTVASTFVQSEAEPLPAVLSPVTRQDIETALVRLESMSGQVKAKRTRKQREQGERIWRLYGLRGLGRVIVTTDLETLERDQTALPMTLGAQVLEQLVERLPLPSHVPLVLETHASGSYRCVEARWVHSDGITIIESANQLMELAQAWDGKQPPPDLRLQAQDEARAAARQRVEAMQKAAQAEEKANLRRQLDAARRRLMRELGRTLRCLGDGDLTELLRKQVQRESHPDGRYHRALKLLGGYPTWYSEDITDVEAFARRASAQDRKARVAGSEIDAAISDPRWKAQDTLKE
jgi:superfamily II DNA or RNA helicase